MQFTPGIVKTSNRIIGVGAVVWPTYSWHGGNLLVARKVTKQVVEDAMNPKFDDIGKKLDEGLAKN